MLIQTVELKSMGIRALKRWRIGEEKRERMSSETRFMAAYLDPAP